MKIPSLHSLFKCFCELKSRITALEQAEPITKQEYLVGASVTGNHNAANTVLTVTETRADAGWSFPATNRLTFTGEPNYVELEINIASIQPLGDPQKQRVRPIVELLRNNTVIAISATGYQRHVIDDASSSNNFPFRDVNPGTNPSYRLRTQQGNTMTEVVDVTLGSITAKAVI